MSIRFLRDYTVQDREGTAYSKDEVRDDLSPASERHFVNRSIASYVEAGGSKPEKTEADPPRAEPAQASSRKKTKRAVR